MPISNVDPMTDLLGQRLDRCANDGISCDECNQLEACVHWWDKLVTSNPPFRRNFEAYHQIISQFQQMKREE